MKPVKPDKHLPWKYSVKSFFKFFRHCFWTPKATCALFSVPPRITSASPPESVVKVNKPFSLKCGAGGLPYPEIHWFLNGTTLEDVEGYNIGRFSVDNFIVHTSVGYR